MAKTHKNKSSNKESKMASDVSNVLTDAEIADILSSGKPRGVYTQEMHNFWNSGVKAVEVNLTSGIFKDAKASSVAQSFNNARTSKKAPPEWENGIVVKRVPGDEKDGTVDRVFLINKLAYEAG